MRGFFTLGALFICAACAPTTELAQEQREYQRLDYYETTFRPMSEACTRAGGFLIYEDTTRHSTRHADLSYSDMRMAVVRGCAGS